MACERWTEAIIERLYDEIEPARGAALEGHLASCVACRTAFDEMATTRAALREHEPELPGLARVVVLRDPGGFRPWLLAASILVAALLAGVGAGAGYALGRHGSLTAEAAANPAVARPAPASLDPGTEDLVRREVERRASAFESSLLAARSGASPGSVAPGMSEKDLQVALAKFERKINGSRAAELDYLLTQIEASEIRTGARIGQTNQALRYVALASNPNVSER